MIVGFSKHGIGPGIGPIGYVTEGAGPVNYVIRARPLTRPLRDPLPVILRGDPDKLVALIDSVPFRFKYSSGILSFSPGEKISPEMETRIIDEFERIAFPSLGPDRRSILWVRHGDGHHHLHFVTARMDLLTGKSLNIRPPGKAAQELFDTFRTKINAEYGLADPDEPQRAQETRVPGHIAKFRAQERRRAGICPSANRTEKACSKPLSPAERRALEEKLETLVAERARYNQARYGGAEIQEPETYKETNDGTRTTITRDAQPSRSAVPPARPRVCQHAQSIGEAAQRWSRANGALELAGAAVERASGLLEPGIVQARYIQQQQEVNQSLIAKYGASAVTPPLNRHRGFDREPEIGGL